MFYGKDGGLTGSDKEFQDASMLALHLPQSALAMNSHLSLAVAAAHGACARPRGGCRG
ncbi:hypothetical protein IM697_30520 [Streptomyces ferrugineus]|uniref:Uncharacterized protein n=1 Tax=Streptomyces ferrugineus TaxID=1413221 RepID=A0A7M2SG39_9ACTN|nr:hypothetical protein [Streptomyces ferrugineus]QOV34438.1 hypothetical protein IM697_30520 [Streptomyces ferrugineus]